MKIEVILTPSELPSLAKRDLRDTVCVVFDVLRATSAFVTALQNGAKEIIPVSEISEALAIRQKKTEVLLAGERDGVKIRAGKKLDKHFACQGQVGSPSCDCNEIDFDFGNSPREFAPEKIRGKTIVSTTTNGTRALRACIGAKMVFAGSFLNLSATAKFIQKFLPEEILLVCAGTRENAALEDILAAGALIEILQAREDARLTFPDSARIALNAWAQAKSNLTSVVSSSENARRLSAIPELCDDVPFCLQRDVFQIVAKMETDGVLCSSY